ncbi:hypothetical protein BJ123_11049 [Rhodopseudomonas thermotolerans]|uniref:Uncharacterized protein n=2 Tax=Rhodopseudomonas TaxID=1073 RepID=A0A336JNH9_9BRAD|nr:MULTISPECIES: hypothetical protein [Rhodopseudomonas]RED34413.1 hypothetical protein BJ125_11049 [Rhodopseudomonas pentothenatexigens]REG02609.1 hypothetical protein BJ123_11049 [Rhodopseudomonas thermotolerans]SSW91082.1 hypothetical protein SAMN05892882_11049 [Rhodopseudomonas pentothenatexigens]
MTSRLFAGLIVFTSFVGGAAVAQEQGTAAQREACTPDAFRLCGQFIPDAARIEGCLRDAGPRLSPACYVVFNPPKTQQRTLRTVRRQPAAPDYEQVDVEGRMGDRFDRW